MLIKHWLVAFLAAYKGHRSDIITDCLDGSVRVLKYVFDCGPVGVNRFSIPVGKCSHKATLAVRECPSEGGYSHRD